MNYPLIFTDQFKKESTKWLIAIKRRENVIVVFFPKTDRLLRIQQLLENPEEMKQVLGDISQYIFLDFEFGLQDLEDRRDLHNHIAGRLNNSHLLQRQLTFEQWFVYLKDNQKQLILVVPMIEKLWSAEGNPAHNAISSLVNDYNSLISILSFSEQDVMHPSVLPYLPDSMRLYQNIFYYPLYSPTDSLNFIRYLQNKWNMKVTEDIENRILQD
ncbi:MAG: hypothetical protein AAB874_04625 [Patescibacteria group bacterium]